jgi:antitoxin (DNA-binding transcriptional repressor) of toxin-antitoxin stability system
MIGVEVEEAGERLEELVEAALRGEEVILELGGVPQVAIVPIRSNAEDDQSARPAG